MRETHVAGVRAVLALALCTGWCAPLAAQAPPRRAEELMRQWDLNRDGKIDAGEAEVARTKMRRSRSEALKNDDVDPVTGRPRAAADTPSGRGAAPAAGNAAVAPPTDDGGLILLPGTGEQPPPAGPMLAEPAAPPSRRERDPLPGTRAPAVTTTIPSVPAPSGLPGDTRARTGLPSAAAGGDPRSGDLTSRARILPDGSTAPAPPQAAGRRPSIGGQPPVPQRPGVIAGGPRPTSGLSQSLNAGRLPGGLPQTRGVVPGVNAPYTRGPAGGAATPSPGQPYGGAAGSRGTASRGPVPLGGIPSGAGGVGGTRAPQQPAAAASRSGMRPQVPPSPPRTQPPVPAVPRPPRVGPEDYFGR